VPATKITALAAQVYPPDFSGTQPYRTQTERLKLAIGEALIDCNAFGLNFAYSNNTHGYLFNFCPGLHTQDVPYTFFNGEFSDTLGLVISRSAAEAMQKWVVDFTILGYGGSSATTQLPLYGPAANVLDVPSFNTVKDAAANARCQFWLNGLTP
jgi:hypothetical protein